MIKRKNEMDVENEIDWNKKGKISSERISK